MPGKDEAVCIPNGMLQIFYVPHVHIKDTAALLASYVIMIAAKMVETIRSAGDFSFPDLASFTQSLQVPVHSRSADIRMFPGQRSIDFISRCMRLELMDCFENQSALNRIAYHRKSILYNNCFYLRLYINKNRMST